MPILGLVLLLDDWRLDRDDRLDTASLGNLHDAAHAGRLGNVLTVNGQPGPIVPVRFGERLRLRLLNVANARVMTLQFEGLTPSVVALDGQPVAARELQDGRLRLAPGERADLLVDVSLAPGTLAPLELITRGGTALAVEFAVRPQPARAEPLSTPFVLPPNPLPATLDTEAARYRGADGGAGRVLAVELLIDAIYDTRDFHVVQVDRHKADQAESEQADKRGQYQEADGRDALLTSRYAALESHITEYSPVFCPGIH